MSDVLLERLQAELPIAPAPYAVAGAELGLVIANATSAPRAAGGAPVPEGALPPRAGEALARCDRLARRFVERRWPVLAFLDLPGAAGATASPPAPALAWLQDEPDVTLLGKDCVGGFVGAIEAVHHGTHGTSHNRAVDWINLHRLRTVLIAGLCTDVCVLDLVLALLAARAHGLMPTLRDLVVFEPATATYALPAHPEPAMHHLGLHLMATRGAVVASAVEGL